MKFDLTVQVNGFSSNEGRAFIGIYRATDDFPEMNKQYRGKVVEIENKIAKVSFDDLPKGEYAVAVYHDKNKNGIMDKNLLGMPTEKYGFSNNARETFSAPSFQSASVLVDKAKMISIYVK
jgi:uncharacterized protein (DUF2141 family)